VETPAPVLSAATVERLGRAAERLLAGDGAVIRLRLFLPAASSSAAPQFDAELAAVAEAMEGTAPRLARVDVSFGPHGEDAVTAMRGLGILPRTGGDAETVRALVVAVDDRLVPVLDLAPERGRPAVQLLLALHRVLRGPVRIGVVAPTADPGAGAALAEALADFSFVAVDETTDPASLAAVLVLATGAGPLPARTKSVVDGALDSGRGVLVLGGRRAVRDGRDGRTLVASPSDPSRLLAGTGVALGEDVVVDPGCARVSVPAGPGRLFLSYPPFVRTTLRLPGGAGEATAVLPFASPLRVEEGDEREVLARSSAESWLDDGAQGWNPSRSWLSPETTGSQVLAVAVRLPVEASGRGGGRLVVVSTAEPAGRDGLTLEANVAVLAGLVAWAADVEEVLLLGVTEEEDAP
jgi:hypothetical protein